VENTKGFLEERSQTSQKKRENREPERRLPRTQGSRSLSGKGGRSNGSGGGGGGGGGGYSKNCDPRKSVSRKKRTWKKGIVDPPKKLAERF